MARQKKGRQAKKSESRRGKPVGRAASRPRPTEAAPATALEAVPEAVPDTASLWSLDTTSKADVRKGMPSRAAGGSHSEAAQLVTFAETVFQDVLARAETAGDGEYLENEFTRYMLEALAHGGEIDDEWDVAYHQARGVKANGYGRSTDQDTVILVCTEFTGERPPRSVTRTDVETGFRRLRAFLAKALEGDRARLEESSPGFEMVDQIAAWRPTLSKARLYFLTDGLTPGEPVADTEVGGLLVTHQVWDLRRTFRLTTSGQQREPVDVDFSKLACGPLPYLTMPGSSPEYSAYLLIVPGDALASIYEQYGTRVLERNVRAFLQARGKVNKGIRETIRKEPQRFLAYNNGISATGAEVSFTTRADGTPAIERVRDFQIVNGGQTTASLCHARRKDKADVSAVAVQAKLSVVEPSKLDELVPVISRYANSQNKVSEADFSANDAFHVMIEKISRTVWTPARPGEQHQTRWFYERARGQYADAVIAAGTPANQRRFKQAHPPKQRFTKTDLAKYENSWMQFPHLVSRGAEKNFREFTLHLKARGGAALATEDYFRHLVGRAVLFRKAQEIVTALAFGDFRSQTVAYTVAYLSHATGTRLDFDTIWRTQSLPESVHTALLGIAPAVHASITALPAGKNISEWCKKEDCWKSIRELVITLPSDILAVAAPSGERPSAVAGRNGAPISEESAREIAETMEVPAAAWFEIAAWAKETNNLMPWQRSLAFNMGKYAERSRAPSEKQARQAVKIVAEARRLGFREEVLTVP